MGNLCQVVADPSKRIATRYRIGITPYYLAIDERGILRSKGIVNDLKGVRAAADALPSSVDDIEVEWERQAVVVGRRPMGADEQ